MKISVEEVEAAIGMFKSLGWHPEDSDDMHSEMGAILEAAIRVRKRLKKERETARELA